MTQDEDKIVAIKTGDIVLHKPSGERWLVAYAENGYVCACGWPETLARESDCQLLERASEEKRIGLLHEIANKPGMDSRREYARRVLGILAVLILAFIPATYATPLLPPLGYEIGEPPAPPPNPNVQYWYTMDVPGPQGVLPVEVFAPRLVAQVASEPAVETPEPGTAEMLALALLIVALTASVRWRIHAWLKKRKAKRKAQEDAIARLAAQLVKCRDALQHIAMNSECLDSQSVARKALEE